MVYAIAEPDADLIRLNVDGLSCRFLWDTWHIGDGRATGRKPHTGIKHLWAGQGRRTIKGAAHRERGRRRRARPGHRAGVLSG